MTYQPGDTILNTYRIEERIGEGSFGEVYRVTHLGLKVGRAIKILKRDAPGLGSTQYADFQQRFQLEAQLGARLNSPTPHPNLLQVHHFHQGDDLLFLEMEYAPGGSLAERIARARKTKQPIPIDEAIQIGIDITSGLAVLHEQDIVHRDVKPSNILFDDRGRAKVADLGLAQIPGGASMRSQLSEPEPHPGTPAYMSIEQKDSRDYLTSASDVYSLGAVLFEMLAGRIYSGQRASTRARSLRSDVPKWLDDLIARMLSENPQARPWDGAEIVALVKQESQDEKRTRWMFRWAIVVAGLILIVGLVLGFEMPLRRYANPTLTDVLFTDMNLIDTPIPVIVQTHTPTDMLTPSQPKTIIPTKTYTPSPFSTQIDLPGSGQIIQSTIDGMDLVFVDKFWIDRHPVTNTLFQTFVNETGYITDAEKDGIGYIWKAIVNTATWMEPGYKYQTWEWELIAGANWQQPQGIGSKNVSNDPVVQVSWNDAVAYCDWADRSLLTWSEWEAGISLESVIRVKENQYVESDNHYTLSEWLMDEVDNQHKSVVWEDILVSWNSVPFSSNGWSSNRSNDHLTFRCKIKTP